MEDQYQYRIAVDEANQTVVVHAQGKIINLDAEQMYSEAFGLLRELGFCRILLDNRAVELSEPLHSIMKLIKCLDSKKMFDQIKVARVVRLDSYRQEFVEQVAGLNSIELKNFDSKDKAILWLKASDQAVPNDG